MHGRWNPVFTAQFDSYICAWLIKIVSLNNNSIFFKLDSETLLRNIYFNTDTFSISFIDSMTFSCILKFHSTFNIYNVWLNSN